MDRDNDPTGFERVETEQLWAGLHASLSMHYDRYHTTEVARLVNMAAELYRRYHPRWMDDDPIERETT